jgi:uncharacterized protein YciI
MNAWAAAENLTERARLKTKNSLESIMPENKGDLPTFVYVLRRVSHESLEKMSSQEEAVVDEHFEYLKKALAEGKLTLAGRCVNAEFGIVIFRAESEKKADEFMRNDPAVKKGVMIAEMHPFLIALIEKS